MSFVHSHSVCDNMLCEPQKLYVYSDSGERGTVLTDLWKQLWPQGADGDWKKYEAHFSKRLDCLEGTIGRNTD